MGIGRLFQCLLANFVRLRHSCSEPLEQQLDAKLRPSRSRLQIQVTCTSTTPRQIYVLYSIVSAPSRSFHGRASQDATFFMYVFAAGGSPARRARPKATLDTKLVRRYRAEQRAVTRVRTRGRRGCRKWAAQFIRLLIHRAFYAVTRRRSSLGQGVSGLSLSRRNEGLEVGSR